MHDHIKLNRRLNTFIHMVVVCSVLCLGFMSGCDSKDDALLSIDFATNSPELENSQFDLKRVKAEVEHFCGDCHTTPPPSAIPKDGWFSEIQLMFQMYEESGRNDLRIPQKGEVVEYYRTLAPDAIAIPSPIPANNSPRLEFIETKHTVAPPNYDQPPPGIANLTWYDSSSTELLDESLLLACEMKSGLVVEMTFDGQQMSYGRQAQLINPSHSTLCDLDQDGVADFLIADLGSFLPEDHQKGSVVWLRGSDDGSFKVDILVDNLGRVTDIQTGDFNQDGQIDLIVAEFGWRATGNVWMLTQSGQENGIPQYDRHRIDDRHGVIHVPTIDINHDGHLDFVSVISQEHESVELFINRGDGTFRQQNIFSANSPAWGSTGIDLVDFDRDGDMDVLYTNGDIFDTFYIVPYHSAHWIENLGDGTWQTHVLGNLPGIHRAVAGDLDNDGDQDVVCSSLISRPLEGVSTNQFDSLIWIEQTEQGEFVPHSIETGNCNHATVVVADFDGDGDLDIATAQFEDTAINPRSDISIWWNNSIIPL